MREFSLDFEGFGAGCEIFLRLAEEEFLIFDLRFWIEYEQIFPPFFSPFSFCSRIFHIQKIHGTVTLIFSVILVNVPSVSLCRLRTFAGYLGYFPFGKHRSSTYPA